jgi:hypothetical protein
MATSVYVAGPMRGYPRFNFDNFERYTQILRSMGYVVMSPHEHDLEVGINPDTDEDSPVYAEADPQLMKDLIMWDLNAVANCDAIFLLDGWEKSRGVKAELALAEFLSKTVLYQSDLAVGFKPVAYA